ncbi:OmpA family protein [Nonomuraea sp. N2-4H]|uniref:OmpA family protein n=1 Tax=Nonomuraea sp. N2-4H TaxID=3128898 RepID=UPI00324485EC
MFRSLSVALVLAAASGLMPVSAAAGLSSAAAVGSPPVAGAASPLVASWGASPVAGVGLPSHASSGASPTPAPTVPDGAAGPVEDLVLPVEDIIGEVESMDGTESEITQGKQVTVAVTSDVLFALDKWQLTAKARDRLAKVARKVQDEVDGGVVKIEGHTDDQGTDAYNRTLSLRRAQAVEKVMRGLLAGSGVTLQARGFGESRPKLPNVVKGKPVEENRAKNRRVEIIFTAKQ